MRPPGGPPPLESGPRGVGEILDAGFRLFRRHFWTLIAIVALVAVPVAILQTLIESSTTENAFDLDEPTVYTDEGAYIAGQLVSGLLGAVVYALATAACFKALTEGYLGRRVGARESLRAGASRLHSALWISLLLIVAVLIGLEALILPGIWLAVAFSLAIPALMVENLRGAKALQRSFGLVRNRWWATFGTLLMTYLIVAAISFVLGLLLGAVLLTDIGSDLLAAVVLTLVNLVVTVVTTPLVAAVVTLVYFDLRIRKEGFDIGHALERPPASAPHVPSDSGFLPPQAPSGEPPPR